ncbi:hypothetical protein NRY95_15735 [Xanthomonas campestris pv. phormiicola]|nr:hypothetical protein [Xanthomonas campestris pv. phormiicola]UYC15171.1 hypothetical protein NRY95_15735 [Xanthomonas campestris pv. phormiicola]
MDEHIDSQRRIAVACGESSGRNAGPHVLQEQLRVPRAISRDRSLSR